MLSGHIIMSTTSLHIVIILLWLKSQGQGQLQDDCVLTLEPSRGTVTVASGNDVNFVCNATCLGTLTRDQLLWRGPSGNPVSERGTERVHAVKYNRWRISRLVVKRTEIADSGVYVCEVQHDNRLLQFAAVLQVEDNFLLGQDSGPRRGDISIQPEPVFPPIRPKRMTSDLTSQRLSDGNRRNIRNRFSQPLVRSRSSVDLKSASFASSAMAFPIEGNFYETQGEGKKTFTLSIDLSDPIQLTRRQNEVHHHLRFRRQSQTTFDTLFPGVETNREIDETTAPYKETNAPYRETTAQYREITAPFRKTTPPYRETTTSDLSLSLWPGNNSNSETVAVRKQYSTKGQPVSRWSSTFLLLTTTVLPSASGSSVAEPRGKSVGMPGYVTGIRTASAEEAPSRGETEETDFGRYGMLAFGLALGVVVLLLYALLLILLVPRCCRHRKLDVQSTSIGSSNSDAILMGDRTHKPLAQMTSATGLNGEYVTAVDLDSDSSNGFHHHQDNVQQPESYVSTFLIGRLSSGRQAADEKPEVGPLADDDVFQADIDCRQWSQKQSGHQQKNGGNPPMADSDLLDSSAVGTDSRSSHHSPRTLSSPHSSQSHVIANLAPPSPRKEVTLVKDVERENPRETSDAGGLISIKTE